MGQAKQRRTLEQPLEQAIKRDAINTARAIERRGINVTSKAMLLSTYIHLLRKLND